MPQNRLILLQRTATFAASAAIVLLASLPSGAATATETAAPAAASVVGTFDLETVEDLALFFAEESYRRLRVPILMRLVMIAHGGPKRREMIAELRADPPKADADGVVHPFGPSNPLSFAYDPETRTLTCWERLVRMRGSVSFTGLTGPELATALNAGSSRQADRGGSDFGYDPIGDALSLRRRYVHPPGDRERFYQEIDRLLAAQMKWFDGRYLEEAIAIAESRLPPAAASARHDGFGATLILRHFSAPAAESQHFVERYFRAWDRPPGRQAPRLVSDRQLAAGRRMHFFVHFQGAENNDEGIARVDAVFRLLSPDGSTAFDDFDATVWSQQAQAPDHLHIGVNNTFLTLEDPMPAGIYRLEAEVCDVTAGRCVELTHPFELLAP